MLYFPNFINALWIYDAVNAKGYYVFDSNSLLLTYSGGGGGGGRRIYASEN